MMLDDTTTTSPFELSTGAADATAYHDFYRVQVAFEPVWAELLDANVPISGAKLYAAFDALMAQNPSYYIDDSGNDLDAAGIPLTGANITGRSKRFSPLYQKDGNGNIVYEKDAAGNFVYETDAAGNLIYYKDASGNIVTDPSGNPIPI